MFWRACTFLLFQLAGGGIGAWLAARTGAVVGLAAGGLAWLALDLLHTARLLHWLRGGGEEDVALRHGVWGEIAERMRRALRTRDRRAQEAEGRLQEFLAAIQASPNGVVLLDREGRIEWCNQTAATQLGIDPQRDLMQLVGNLLRDPAFAAYQAQGDYGRDVVVSGRDNSPGKPVRLSLQLHPYGDGRRLLLSRDITALDQADAMRRDFVANVSHEIRTPLTVLAGFIETLQQLPLPDEDRARYLQLMAQQASRMQTLVADLLTLSRLEGSPLPRTAEWMPVAGLLAHCEQEARSLSTLLGKSHELHFDASVAEEVAGSASELQSAVSNLVSNAVRYTPAGGRITVQWRRLPGGRGEIVVQDSGPGIPAEHLPRITERFYRVDRSRSRETGGTGLGLAIVKHVAQRHGGELRIDSRPGTGSTFAIVLPATRVRSGNAGGHTQASMPSSAAAD